MLISREVNYCTVAQNKEGVTLGTLVFRYITSFTLKYGWHNLKEALQRLLDVLAFKAWYSNNNELHFNVNDTGLFPHIFLLLKLLIQNKKQNDATMQNQKSKSVKPNFTLCTSGQQL